MNRLYFSDGGLECRSPPKSNFNRALNLILNQTSQVIIVLPVVRQLRVKQGAAVDDGGLAERLENKIEDYPNVSVSVYLNQASWTKYDLASLQKVCNVYQFDNAENEQIVGDSHLFLSKAVAVNGCIERTNTDNFCRHTYNNAEVCFERLISNDIKPTRIHGNSLTDPSKG